MLANDRDRDGRADRGDSVRVVVVVTNSGQVPLRSVRITDALVQRLGSSFRCGTSVLGRGASTTCRSGSVTVTRFQAKRQVFRNTVRATAQTASGGAVRSALSTATLRVQPFVKSANGRGNNKGNKGNKAGKGNKRSWVNRADKGNRKNQWDRVRRDKGQRVKRSSGRPLFMAQYVLRVADKNKNGRLDANDTVRFGFRVTNTGSMSATGLQIVDRRLKRFKVAISCEATELTPGETTTCTSGPMRITKYQAKNKLGRNFAYASATAGGEAIRSNSTVVTLVKSISQLRRLPNTGASAGAVQLGAIGVLLVGAGSFLLLTRRRRRPDPHA